MQQLPLGILLSVIITGLALWRGSLSRSGAIGAILVGSCTFGLGGPMWGLLLALFFVTSSALSHFKEREKEKAAEKFEKGSKRDIGQVLANGGLGALLAVLSVFVPWPGWFYLFLGVMATVTADTWATELGTLSQQPPRLVTTGKVVEVGTSGGISVLGTAVSFAGGFLIGLFAGIFLTHQIFLTSLVAGVSGLVGSLTDSFLGATVQQIYRCDHCLKETERKIHKCGRITRPFRGWAWMTNDVVNLISSFMGGLVALFFAFVLFR